MKWPQPNPSRKPCCRFGPCNSRESPALALLRHLLEQGAVVSYHDPHIPARPREWRGLPALESVPLTPEALEESDAVLLVTDHAAVDYGLVLRHARLVVDTRGVYRETDPKVVKA